MQQMAALGFCRGRVGGRGMLTLFRGLLSSQAFPGKEGQQRYFGHRPAHGPNHLATLDPATCLRELSSEPRTPMPASLRELLPDRPGKGKTGFSQTQEADFFPTDFPQPLPYKTGWSLSSRLRRRTLGQDGGLGICLSQWQGGSRSPAPKRSVIPASFLPPRPIPCLCQSRTCYSLRLVFAPPLASTSLRNSPLTATFTFFQTPRTI